MSILQLEGAYENELAATGEFNPQAPKTALMLPSGQRIVLPTELLLGAINGQTIVSQAVQPELSTRQDVTPPSADVGNSRDRVIPLIAEELAVGKAQVETGRVRVRRETEEHVQTVTVPLTDVRWEVEHIPIDQVVETQPEIRQVGDTIVFPMVEERMVVRRELWLREEVHVHKVSSTTEKSADFSVKRDVLVESRTGEA